MELMPVVYIHFGALPDHLLVSARQAFKFNKLIYLLTDQEVNLEHVTVVNIKNDTPQLAEFEKCYVHMSTNKEAFEKMCIKRWLILSEFLTQQNIKQCYYSDSDVMLYADVSEVFKTYHPFEASYTVPEYQENYRWTASACCSFWKAESLLKFSSFILNSYSKENIHLLREKWNYHQQNQISGGVCDMTLLYLFSKTIHFQSLSKVIDSHVFDQNYLVSENYYPEEYEMQASAVVGRDVKKIYWENKIPFGYNLVEKQKVAFFSLTEYARYCNKREASLLRKLASRVYVALEWRLQSLFKKKTSARAYGWFGNYKTWEEAEAQCTGYDSDSILQTVRESVLKVKSGEVPYERDSVLFDDIQYSMPLIAAFRNSVEENRLHIVDFGGSLGSSYFQHKKLFENDVDLKWAVVEQAHFVECGKKDIAGEQLFFYDTIDEALKYQRNQVLFLSSVLPYITSPYELIESLLKYRFKYIVIDRTAFIESNKERITKQIVPPFIYKASYPAWFFNEKKFIHAFSGSYDLLDSFDSAFDPTEKLEDGVKAYRKGFYFKLKQDADL